MDTTLVLSPTETHIHNIVELVDPSVEKGARFLDDVQREAESRITRSMLVDVPSIDAKLVAYEESKRYEDYRLMQHVVFKINGKELKVKVDASAYDIFSDRLAAVRKLSEALSNEILSQCLLSPKYGSAQ